MKLFAAIIAAYLLLFLASITSAQDEMLPVNAPIIQEKAIKIMTAEERSEIIISDIWEPPELERIKIGKGGRLGAVKSDSPTGPYGWQAFVAQDAIGSGRGGRDAEAYGGL